LKFYVRIYVISAQETSYMLFIWLKTPKYLNKFQQQFAYIFCLTSCLTK